MTFLSFITTANANIPYANHSNVIHCPSVLEITIDFRTGSAIAPGNWIGIKSSLLSPWDNWKEKILYVEYTQDHICAYKADRGYTTAVALANQAIPHYYNLYQKGDYKKVPLSSCKDSAVNSNSCYWFTHPIN